MTPEEFATCFVPVEMRWSKVVPGDVVWGDDQAWMAEFVELGPKGVHVQLSRGMSYKSGLRPRFTVDPDEVVQVLTPVPMAQAVQLTREQIGMQLIERRNDGRSAA